MEELNYRELISGIGIEKGNILDIASGLHDIKQYCRSHNLSFDGNHLIDVLKEETGPGGTVMSSNMYCPAGARCARTGRPSP